MPILKNILKKGKKKDEKKEEKVEKKEQEVKRENLKKEETSVLDDNYLKIIERPWISEKASLLSPLNQYVFKVSPRANKIEIKKAIEKIYNVSVEEVRIVRVPEKPRRLGRFLGKKPSFKKAIVKLKEGENIEIMPK